jgi:hypothetical protein
MNWKFDFSPVTSAGRGDDQSWSSGFFALHFGTVMAWAFIWNLHMMGGTLERGGARCLRRAVDVRWGGSRGVCGIATLASSLME